MLPTPTNKARIALLFSLLLAPAIGCSTPKPEPEIASSAALGGYAEGYATELNAANTDFSTQQADVKQTIAGFGGYPRALKGPGKPYAKEVLTKADESGRSHAYVETLREVKETQAFFDREKDEITRKVAGSANYAAKQKNCDVDVGGAVSASLKESVDKQLEKRLRAGNEGHRIIERNREAIGKEDAATLEKQADDVAYASYVTNVQIVELKLKIRRMAEEAETIKATADREIKTEEEFAKDPKRTPAEKKASQDRVAAMNKAKADVDAASGQAKALSEAMDNQVSALQTEYKDAIKTLLDSMESN
ncbi:MAG: hypothetical protein WKG00_18665 [Polyangiaceae bacterium]